MGFNSGLKGLKGKETIVKIDIHTNIYIETNPVNIPWNTDR
jgi:hypothetical protein